MHTEMWEHPAVQDNLAVLRRRGVHVVEPETGRLAGGDHGAGRLASPERIVGEVERVLGPGDMDGWHVLISAGGTREPIDAVRVIANRSSGKQGYALAHEALSRGARVTLVSTVDLPLPPGVDVRRVETAAEMRDAMIELSPDADVVVMAAAVADFRPVAPKPGKIKKGEGVPQIVLEPTPDIVAGLGEVKPANQVLVGFAAETDDLVANAHEKLRRKRLDLIVANDVGAPGVGFQHDTNAVTLIRAAGSVTSVSLTDKRAIARAILDSVCEIRQGAGDLD
jgi:phosphopantothenoylcysteine decarboxylase/phosphopantothenate--cysteine ligase